MLDLHGSPDTGSPQCCVFFLFLRGEVLGQRKGCKEGRAVSEILVTVQLPRPDARTHTPSLLLGSSRGEFAWW